MAKTLFLILVMTATTSLAKKCDSKCSQSRTHGMKSADCYNLSLNVVPQCLRDDVQILDLSHNRLRTISNDTFSKYTNLKHLYLQDNFITQIEPKAFVDLRNLEVLDLSLNGIQTLPPIIFHLPSLKRLYLGNNKNINIAEIVDYAQPITSPLEYLDLSFNEMHELPNLGTLPDFFSYNVSGNNLWNMSPKDFAGLCKLTNVYNDNFTTEFQDICDCWRLTKWFSDRNVYLSNEIICKTGTSEEHCEMAQVSDEDRELFDQCTSLQHSLTMTRSFVNYGLPILCAILIIIIIILYCYCKKCKRRQEDNVRNGPLTRNVEPLVPNSYS